MCVFDYICNKWGDNFDFILQQINLYDKDIIIQKYNRK